MPGRHVLSAALLAVAVIAGAVSAVGLPKLPVPVAPEAEGILAGVSRGDAANIRAFYEALADIVARDGSSSKPLVSTTLQLRQRHEHALRMAFAHTGIVGKYPQLGEKLDAYLLEAIGSTDVPLTPDLRDKAARAFLAVK
jgi:hypothetical protein